MQIFQHDREFCLGMESNNRTKVIIQLHKSSVNITWIENWLLFWQRLRQFRFTLHLDGFFGRDVVGIHLVATEIQLLGQNQILDSNKAHQIDEI